MEVRPAMPVVVIVESDNPTAILYSRELGKNFQVVLCADDISAFEHIQEQEPAAVILEPAGLGDRGWNFLARLKSLPNLRSIPVIVCSTLDERRKGLEMGAVSFLVKPVLPSALLQALRQAMHTQV